VGGRDGPTCLRTFPNPLARAGTGLARSGTADLFEKIWPKGAGELGESVYGLKADFRWPFVGEGMSWVAVAMLHCTALH
jgi:hypothetical protein